MTVRTITGNVNTLAGVDIPNATFSLVPESYVFGSTSSEVIFGEQVTVEADASGDVAFDLHEGKYVGRISTSQGAKSFRLTVDSEGPWTLGRLIDASIGEITPSLIQQAFDAADRAESARDSILSEYQGRQYATRAEFVNDDTYAPDDGTVVTAGGLAYLRQAGADVLPGLAGWLPVGEITAAHFGFDVAGSGLDNRAAIESAVQFAGGMPVTVTASVDYNCDRLELSTSAHIVFRGAGRAVRAAGTWAVLNGGYADVQTVTDISNVSRTIQGSSVTVARLSVSDETAYNKNDVVRVVSNDDDPYDPRTDRRRGETAVVIDTASGFIFLTAPLEDSYDTSKNCRVSRLIPRKFKIEGAKVKSAETNTSVILQMNACLEPEIELNCETHGQIVVNSKGSVWGKFRLKGEGVGNSSGNLGYLFNDSSGTNNIVDAPDGKYFRHVTTTNADSVDLDSASIQNYGACRGHTVINGRSYGAQGAPWDDHPGARGTVWRDCADFRAMRSSSSAPAAFQCRGRDAQIINPITDGTQEALVRFSSIASGITTIINPAHVTSNSSSGFLSYIGQTQAIGEVHVHGGFVRWKNVQTCVRTDFVNMKFFNTVFESLDNTRSYPQIFDIRESAILEFYGHLRISGTPTNLRLGRLYNTGVFRGRIELNAEGLSLSNSFRAENTGVRVECSIRTEPSRTAGLNTTGTFDFAETKVYYGNGTKAGDVRGDRINHSLSKGPRHSNVPTYADNAAAVSGGLSVGELYIRTGHGLDIVV